MHRVHLLVVNKRTRLVAERVNVKIRIKASVTRIRSVLFISYINEFVDGIDVSSSREITRR